MVWGEKRERPTERLLARAAHPRVRGHTAETAGRFPAGTPYRADDPDLLVWILASLVNSASAPDARTLRDDSAPGSAGSTVERMSVDRRNPSAAAPLERHPSLGDRFDPAVRIVDCDPAWPALADAELRRITQALGDVAARVEHVGSTAVPGLAAKPIVDLQLAVDRLEPRERYIRPLEQLGYVFAPAPESPDSYFFAKPPERPRTHHLHVCAAESETEFRHVAVRDFLRADADEAARYEVLKREVASRHPQDRLAYIEGKDAYVTALDERAVTWARGRGCAPRTTELR